MVARWFYLCNKIAGRLDGRREVREGRLDVVWCAGFVGPCVGLDAEAGVLGRMDECTNGRW